MQKKNIFFNLKYLFRKITLNSPDNNLNMNRKNQIIINIFYIQLFLTILKYTN